MSDSALGFRDEYGQRYRLIAEAVDPQGNRTKGGRPATFADLARLGFTSTVPGTAPAPGLDTELIYRRAGDVVRIILHGSGDELRDVFVAVWATWPAAVRLDFVAELAHAGAGLAYPEAYDEDDPPVLNPFQAFLVESLVTHQEEPGRVDDVARRLLEEFDE